MNRYNFYFEQLVTEAQMDQSFSWAEEADWRAMTTAILGKVSGQTARGAIHWGATVTENASPSMSVIVTPGACSDPTGRHVSWDLNQSVDCSFDYQAAATDVVAPGNEKYLGLFALWKRDLTNAVSDGNGLTVYFEQYDSFELQIHQGVEASAGAAVPPSTPADSIRLTNILIAYAETQILNANIEDNIAGRLRDDYVRVIGVNLPNFVYGNPSDAIADLFDKIDTYSSSGSVTFLGTSDWHDSSGPLSSVNVQNAINEIVADLAEDNVGSGGQWGSDKIGSDAYATAGNYADLARGSVSDQLRELADYIDDKFTFSFTSTWWGGQPVSGTSPPPTNVFEALDAIVHDLASTSGAERVGMQGWTSINGYVSWTADRIGDVLTEIGTALDGHINGDPPQHPTASISATDYDDWAFLNFEDNSALASSGLITNAAGGQAAVFIKYSSTDFGDLVLVHSLTGTWIPLSKVKNGASYSDPPDGYFLGKTGSQDLLEGANLELQLQNIAKRLAERPGDEDSIVRGEHSWEKNQYLLQGAHTNCLTEGGGSPNLSPPSQLKEGVNLSDTSQKTWGHGENNTIATISDDLVDICKGWAYDQNKHCVYAVGDRYSGDCVVVRTFVDNHDNFLTTHYGICTADASGTPLTTANANAELYGVCSDGERIYVLAQRSASGAAAAVHCYDAKLWDDGGLLKWIWSTDIPVTTGSLGTRKTDSRIRCSTNKIWVLQGAENVDLAGTGTPIASMSSVDGSGVIQDKGDPLSTGGTPCYPQGGLTISKDNEVFFSVGISGAGSWLVPADSVGASTGKGTMGFTATQCREVLIPGYRNVVGIGDGEPNTIVYPNDCFGTIKWWDWNNNTKDYQFFIPVYQEEFVDKPMVGDFDGVSMWIKVCMNTTGDARLGDNYGVFAIHGAELAGKKDHIYTPQRVYQINEARVTTSGKEPGRICAWGPGIWNIPYENDDSKIGFMPFSKLSG
ncbi:MAG: hypothetical protein GY841_15480 [FCB group bacterium]|nr:hypothetical protein [FCB group bacterium]